jgi:RHS repeat-associated protein
LLILAFLFVSLFTPGSYIEVLQAGVSRATRWARLLQEDQGAKKMIKAIRLACTFIAMLGCFATHANAAYWYYGGQDNRPLKFYETATQYCEALVARWNMSNSGSGWPYSLRSVEIVDPEFFGMCIVRWEIPPEGADLPAPVEIVDCKDPHSAPQDRGPAALASCSCNAGYKADPFHPEACIGIEDSQPEPPGDPRCTAGLVSGNPILLATAEKYRAEEDFVDPGPAPLHFTRIYRSTWGMDAARAANTLGKAWTHIHDASLKAAGTSVIVTSAEGYVRTFMQLAGTSSWSATNSADTLLVAIDGGWTYRRAEDDSTSNFDAAGRLTSAVARNGWATTYLYNAALQLASIRNAFGRTLTLSYSGSNLTSVTTPDARVIDYGYDASGRLSTVTYPDGKTRSFVYENTSFPLALTGIVDETDRRWGSFLYDIQGRPVVTLLAGGVDLYQVSYPSYGTTSVIDPLGTSRSYSYGTALGKLAVTSGSLPSATGEADAASRVQDANGLITSETDFKGVITTTTWDTARRLPLSITRASGAPEAQTVTTQWHATFSLPVLVTETGRTTAYTYDAQGNLLSQAITDTSSSPNTTRTWQWTYNAQGLAATQAAPNGAVTTYTYDTLGNLTQAVNALGHTTQYAYDTANRVTSSTAPNGLVTTYTYDARDRLLTRTVGGQQTTTLSYNPTGTIDTLTLPTGLVLGYTYDAAHRLTGWSNNRGEQGSFTLDAMGNRTAEQVKDASGAVAWNAVRSINNINRLSAITEGANQTNTFGYDANGELITQTNGLNQSIRYGLDGLRRVTALTNAASATATLAWNALNDITQAQDFKGVATHYTRDAQGNATSEASSDAGSHATQYDALGLPSQIVDALGQATTIQRDPLGRPILLIFADGKTTTLSYDSPEVGKGYLAAFTDRSGTTRYQRDLFGRITAKTQALTSGLVQQVGYAYAASGLPASTVYPDGSTLGYVYDGTGRLAGLNWNGTPLISGIIWNPMGQPTGWNWAFAPGVNASRSYDTAGRLTGTEFSGYVYDAAGRMTSLVQQLFQPADTDFMHSSVASTSASWNVSYDAVGRITGFDAAGDTASFSYDPNGNRTGSTRTVNGQTTTRRYGVGSSNLLLGFSQTQAGAVTTGVGYGYNANGDLTHDGLRTFSYDAEGRPSNVTLGASTTFPTTRYAHNALGQRVFKTEPLYPPSQPNEADPAFVKILIAFFTELWGSSSADADKLGWAFTYDEDGNLIAETGTGGANSTGSTQHIYLPTATGAMPIVAVISGARFAVHSDHLNTPRRLTNDQGQPVWQWAYSAFGDNQPTTAKYRFADPFLNPNSGTTGFSETLYNKRYDGQYFDKETWLNYNYFRSYSAERGRYMQPDPMGLAGGWNRVNYVNLNPLRFTDPRGLMFMSTVGSLQRNTTLNQAATYGAAGSAAAATGLAGAMGGAAATGAGVAYLAYVPAPARTAIGLLKGLSDDAIPPPAPPQPPLLTPPAVIRPGGFSPPAPPPGICPRL